MKVRKDRLGSQLIVLWGENQGHVAKADLISQFPKDPISPAALLT